MDTKNVFRLIIVLASYLNCNASNSWGKIEIPQKQANIELNNQNVNLFKSHRLTKKNDHLSVYKYSIVEPSTTSYDQALETISLSIPQDYRGHITECSFIVGENEDVFVKYKIDDTPFIAQTKTQFYQGGININATLQLIDFNEDGLEELCITFSEMDNNNGFESGFELETHNLLILDIKNQLVLADQTFSYEYMEYTDEGEEDDVHGKMDEDSKVDYCYQSQKLSFMKNGFTISVSSEATQSSIDYCVKVIPDGQYQYNSSRQSFETVE